MAEPGDIVSKNEETSSVKGGAWRTFLKRAASTVLLLLFLSAVYLSENAWVYVGAFTLFCGITSWEWCSMLKKAGISCARWLVMGAGIIYPLLLGCSLVSSEPAWLMKLPVNLYVCLMSPAIVTILAFLWELRKPVEGKNTLLSITGNLLSFIYPVWMFSFALFLLFPFAGPEGQSGEPKGLGIFLWVFLVTKMMDIGAYISGSLFGRHKMIPHISPKKTWEGFWGACIFTALTGYGLACFPEGELYLAYLNFWGIILIALGLGLLSVVGDLAGSVIKRALGVKDSGKILPGIGGIFDLVDSPAFTFPVAALAILLFFR